MENPNLTETGKEAEIDLVELSLTLWSRRKIIAIGTGAIVFIGLVYALLASPLYTSKAIISPKKSSQSSAPSAMLASLGGFGGFVASQLGMGDANLDRLEILLKSQGLNQKMIRQHDLLKLLFPDAFGKTGPLDSSDLPTIQDGVNMLTNNILRVLTDNKRNTLTLSISFRDPALAKKLVEFYLEALSDNIKDLVVNDAEQNMEYLGKRLTKMEDPLMRDKLQNLISVEMEKAMLVHSCSFDVLDSPIVPDKRAEPKRRLILILSFVIGLFLSTISVLAVIFYQNIKPRFTSHARRGRLP